MLYRIHRMKENPREHFRWASHGGGLAIVKPRDYESSEQIEAGSEYAVWKSLAGQDQALQPGDLLESLTENGTPSGLRIFKYIGFEPAQWFVPESKPEQVFPQENNISSETAG